jgi:hypothetical protein
MPRTDDIRFRLVVFHGSNRLVVRDRFKHPLQNSPLADRASPMGTPIVPSIKLPIDPEDADLHLANQAVLRMPNRSAGAYL